MLGLLSCILQAIFSESSWHHQHTLGQQTAGDEWRDGGWGHCCIRWG